MDFDLVVVHSRVPSAFGKCEKKHIIQAICQPYQDNRLSLQFALRDALQREGGLVAVELMSLVLMSL